MNLARPRNWLCVVGTALLVGTRLAASAEAPRPSPDRGDEGLARSVVERYYELEESEDYLGMVEIFEPDAIVRYTLDFGGWWPEEVIEFEVSEFTAPRRWRSGESRHGELADYVQQIVSIRVAGATSTVRVETRARYRWNGTEGRMSGRDEFQLAIRAGAARISRYESRQSF